MTQIQKNNRDTHSLDKRLQLFDFTQTSNEQLKDKVLLALQKAHEFLDELETQWQAQQTEQMGQNRLSPKKALNHIIAFERIGLSLDRYWGILSHLNAVMSSSDIRAIHHELLPKLSAYGTRVGQSQALFSQYQTVREKADFFQSLEPSRQRAIDLALHQFKLSGVALSEKNQAVYAQIQSRLSVLSSKFADNILDATQAFALPLTTSQLAGLTESGLALLANAGEALKSKEEASAHDKPTPYYVATLDIPVYLAVMTYAEDRDLRETLYHAYVTRASEFDSHVNDKGESLNNAEVMVEILSLREQKAKLLGFDNHTEVSLSTKMAEYHEQIESFLLDLAHQAKPAAQKDFQQLQQMGKMYGIDDIQPWDIAFLAEKVKQQAFQLSQEEIRPYFPLPKVIFGLFDIVKKLYGIRIEPVSSEHVTVWHPDVSFYQVFNDNDELIGGFYFDLYARQGKRGGAWMSGFQPKYLHQDSAYEQLPVCFMVANFTPAINQEPSLLTHDEVLTLFHEFGHGLHHLLTQVTVSDVAGVNGVEWDAVELPSQFMENWAWHAEGIDLISGHVSTGQPLPQDKLTALLSAKNFQSGMQTLRQLEFALFDLSLHTQTPAPDYQGILALLDTIRQHIAIMPTPEYNRFANGFSHIFAGGYAAGYYSYKWAELLSADAFSKFEEQGIFDAKTGQEFLNYILAVGGSSPAKVNFERFRGRSATIDALLRHSGFIDVNE